jgi:hypothetical protein
MLLSGLRTGLCAVSVEKASRSPMGCTGIKVYMTGSESLNLGDGQQLFRRSPRQAQIRFNTTRDPKGQGSDKALRI